MILAARVVCGFRDGLVRGIEAFILHSLLPGPFAACTLSLDWLFIVKRVVVISYVAANAVRVHVSCLGRERGDQGIVLGMIGVVWINFGSLLYPTRPKDRARA